MAHVAINLYFAFGKDGKYFPEKSGIVHKIFVKLNRFTPGPVVPELKLMVMHFLIMELQLIWVVHVKLFPWLTRIGWKKDLDGVFGIYSILLDRKLEAGLTSAVFML